MVKGKRWAGRGQDPRRPNAAGFACKTTCNAVATQISTHRAQLTPSWNHARSMFAVGVFYTMYKAGLGELDMALGRKLIGNVASFAIATNDVNSIVTQLNDFDVVSFDIFDTLIKRDVTRPADIHEYVSRIYESQTGIHLAQYKARRVDAERLARNTSRREEITLKEIFACLEGVTPEISETLMSIEAEAELRFCQPNKPIVDILNRSNDLGKHTVLISDMYLPEDVIKSMLEKCNITGFDRLYLSSTLMRTKHAGSLFQYVRSQYAQSYRFMHIGDSPYGDYLQAKRNGFSAFLCQTEVHNCRYIERPRLYSTFEDSVIYATANNRLSKTTPLSYVIGYEALGPILLGYCSWLHEKIHDDKIERLFFLSREGKLLKDAYDRLFPNDRIPNSYLYVSRRALIVPQLAHAKDYSDLIHYLRAFLRNDTLGLLGRLCNLDSPTFTEELTKIGLSQADRLTDVSEVQQQALYDIVMRLGGTEFAAQNAYVKDYFREQGLVGKVGLADIGYVGTMQKAIEDITDNDVRTIGYYLGVQNADNAAESNAIIRHGYLFSPNQHESIQQIVRFTIEVFEFLMLNPDGSVVGYQTSDGGVIPVLDESEYDDNSTGLSDQIQKGALDFLDAISDLDPHHEYIKSIVPSSAIAPYASFATHPSGEVLDLFSCVVFLDGERRKIVPDFGPCHSLSNPNTFIEELNQSAAKTFFLSRALLPHLPYFEMLKFASSLGVRSAHRKKFYQNKESEDKRR